MKIRLLKKTKFGQNEYPKGQEIQTDRATGKRLVKSKHAEECEFATLSELHVESKQEDEAEEEYMNLPNGVKERAVELKSCNNEIVLKKCLEDTRETVSLAAQTRLDQLKS